MALSATASAATWSQVSNVKVQPTSGTLAAKGKNYVLLDSYLRTRDPNSTRGTLKPNPVATVAMKFPTGSTVNKTAVGSANVCQRSEYETPATLKTACAKAVIGTGWALLNSGSTVPQPQIPEAPAACQVGDATQYSRDWAANPAAGPDCTPIGYVYTKVTAYQGGVLGSKFWCYGLAWYTNPASSFYNKPCSFKDANGKIPNLQIKGLNGTGGSQPNGSYSAAANGQNIIFSNDNGVAPLSFGGSVNGAGSILNVVIPALNGSGSGLGELAGGIVLVDFALKITNKTFLKAGACPSTKKWPVSTAFTYSKLKGETDYSAGSSPASASVTYNNTCRA